jgi:ferredoxin-NADP reductase
MPQKLYCKVAEVMDHGDGVYSIILKPNSPAPRFLPGQFLHLALDPYSSGDFWPESRVFSIASSPTDRNYLRITYAVKGVFTHRMESELHCGSEVWVKLPYGEFTVNTRSEVCLLAGGTGVTAFTAFLSNLTADYPNPIYLFYGARRTDLLVYRTLIESAAELCSKLRRYYFIEAGQQTGFIEGRINLDEVWKIIPYPQKVTFYLSGPPVMLNILSTDLAERAIPVEHILMDAWE